MFPSNILSPETIYNNQSSKINIKIYSFQCLPLRSAKAYVQQFLTPQNAMYSPIVYLYLMSIMVERNL